MPPIAPILTAILADLRAAVGTSAALVARNPAFAAQAAARSALLVRAWFYIGRTAARLDRLIARFLAGALPKPRAPRPATTRALRPHTPRLPTRRIWLVEKVGYTAAGSASQLNHLLARPDFIAFLETVPQAGRLLRPLCRMLGITPPPAIARPIPPRKPRARPAPKPPATKPAAPTPTLRHGKYTPAEIRRYRPGKIPRRILRPA